MSDGMHLAQEQGERANAELHAELERTVYRALRKIKQANDWRTPDYEWWISPEEFSALCYMCGFKVSDFNGKGKQ